MAVDLTNVPPQMVERFWPHVRDMIDAAYAASDELLPDDIVGELKLGDRVLWLFTVNTQIYAAAVTRFIKRRSGTALQIVAAGGGGLDFLRPLEDRFLQYARHHGCVKVVIKGRRGWLRVLDGYRETEITIEKQVS